MVTQAKRLKTEHEGATVESLSWNHPVHNIGKKVDDPDLINCCMICALPILVYGRMMPCKHVLCYDCAKKHSSSDCAKCGEKVSRIEQCQLGTVFVCSFGTPRHSPGGCRRTYLSYRDMEAHIKHRHQKKDGPPPQAFNVQQPLPGHPAMSQPPPIMTNPPPQYMRAGPSGHIMSHPPPSMAPATNIPPGMPVAGHHHMMQRPANPVTIPTSMNVIPGQPRPLPGSNVVLPGTQSTAVRHSMAPGHVLAPHHTQVHPSRHIRPAVTVRLHNNPPVPNVSKSHGNLISIPLQGANEGSSYDTWSRGSSGSNQQQQQWQMPGHGNHHNAPY